jgi:hypothetical protein
MAVALVKLGAVASSLSPSFGQPTTAGNILVAWLTSNSGNATDPFGSSSPGWVKAVTGGSAFEWTSIWYKADCGASETAPVFTDSGSSAGNSLLGEFSGAAIVSPLDSSGSSSGGSTNQTATNAAPDAAAGDLIIFSAMWNGGNAGGTITNAMTDSGGNSVTPNATDNSGSAGSFYYDFVWGVAGTTGVSEDTATAMMSAFNNGSCAIVSFLAAGSGPAPSAVASFSGHAQTAPSWRMRYYNTPFGTVPRQVPWAGLSGYQYTQSLAVSVASLPVTQNHPGRGITASLAVTAAAGRGAARLVTAVSAVTGIAVRSAGRLLLSVAAVAGTVNAIRMRIAILLVTLAVIPSVQRIAGRIISGVISAIPAVTRTVSRIVPVVAAVIPVLSLQKVKLLALTAQAAAIAALTRQAGRQVPAQAAVSGVLTRSAARTIAGLAAILPGVTKMIPRALTAVLAAAGSLTRAKLSLLAAQAAVTGMLRLNTARGITAITGVAASVSRGISRILAAITACTPALSLIKVKLVVIAAITAATGTVSRNTGRITTAVTAFFPQVTRLTGKDITGTAAVTGSPLRQVTRSLIAQMAALASASASIGVQSLLLIAQAAVSSTLGRGAGRNLSAVSAIIPGATRGISRAIQGIAAVPGMVLRNITRTFSAVSAMAPAISFQKVRLLILDAIAAVIPGIQRRIGSNQAASTGVTSSLIRKMTRTVTGNAAVSASVTAGRAFFMTLAAVISVSASVIMRVITGSVVIIFRLGDPVFRWIAGAVKSNWRIP